jgi:hypothetical protein
MQTELGHPPQASAVPRRRLRLSPEAWVLGTALLLLAGVLLATLALNHGRFFYSLDDAYIHLALASNIAVGHYGIHPGEVAAPSSSVLWPFLLAPFARFSDFVLVPLVLSSALLLVYARLVLRLVEQALPARSPNTQVAIALLVIVATNAVGLVLTGLEHVLQLVCTVWLLAEVHALPRVRRVSRGLVFALILGPLVRYEMLALCVPAALYIAWLGHRRTAAFGLLGIALTLCAFSAFLVAHGLAPLPASVLAKSSVLGGAGLPRAAGVALHLYAALIGSRGLVLVSIAVVTLVFARTRGSRGFALIMLCGAVGHAAAGRFGWYHRYEAYLWAFLSLGALLEFGASLSPRGLFGVASIFALCSLEYVGVLFTSPIASRNIASQQGELMRIARAYDAPIAVNDLGVVAFGSPHYVLDFGGLANPEALRAHREEPDGAWMERMAAAHGVEAALIYDDWFDDLIPLDWVKLAELRLLGACMTPASDRVSVYVRTSDARARMEAVLDHLVPAPHAALVRAGSAAFVRRKRSADACQE